MNWDAVAAIAEVIGAVGVMASLLYLAKQIRLSSEQTELNSNMMRCTAHQQFCNQVNHVVELRVSSPELAELMDRGMQDYDGLNPQDKGRFRAMMYMTINNWESMHLLQQHGILQAKEWAITSVVSSQPGFAQWWRENRLAYSGDFRAQIDELAGRRQA